MLNSSGLWERQGGQVKGMMSRALVLQNQEWVAAFPTQTLSKIQLGNPAVLEPENLPLMEKRCLWHLCGRINGRESYPDQILP